MSKAKFESDTNVELFENCSKNVININDEFYQIFESSYTFYRNRGTLRKKKIRTMNAEMDKLFHEIINSENTKLDNIMALAEAYHIICYTYIITERKKKFHIAKDSILNCLDLIKDKELNPNIIFLALKSYHCLGFLYSRLNQMMEAIQTYDKSVDLYFAYTYENDENQISIDIKDISVKSSAHLEERQKLKDMYMIILNSLMDFCTRIKPANNLSLIISTHSLLITEWHTLPQTEGYFKWINKAMTLCVHLLKYSRFKEALYYINVAIYLKTTFIDKKCDCIKKGKISSKVCEWCNQSTTALQLIINCQAKYTIALLGKSAKRLLRLERGDDCETDSMKLKNSTTTTEQYLPKLVSFSRIEKEYTIPNECQLIKIEYVSNNNVAQQMFAKILNMLHDMGLHCQRNIKTYEEIILDTCKAYKYMALFEKNATSRMLLQKRRVEILSEAVTFIYHKNSKIWKYFRLHLAIAHLALIEIVLENFEKDYLLFTSLNNNDFIVEVDDLLQETLMNFILYKEN